jgi:hypothetical protein
VEVSDCHKLRIIRNLARLFETITVILLAPWIRRRRRARSARVSRYQSTTELNFRSSIHDAEKFGQPELSRLCLPQAISQPDHSVADALPFAQIEAVCILKTDIGEKPASFANKLHV